MIRDGPFLLLEVFLIQLASHLELFMSFLFPRLHPFFLILLSYHLFALWSCHFVGPSTLPIVLCLKLWFVSMNDFLMVRAYDFKFVEQDLSFFQLVYIPSNLGDEDIDSCMFFSCHSFLIFVDSSLTRGYLLELQNRFPPSIINEMCLHCAKLLEFIMCLASSLIEFISWLTQIELRVSCRG